MKFGLQNKTIIVTGASSHVGRACSEALIAHGANLVMADLDDVSEWADRYAASEGNPIALRIDVSDPVSIEAMAFAAFERFGRIDGIVNIAEIVKDYAFDPCLDDLTKALGIRFGANVGYIRQCCRAVMPYMRHQDGGKIVNISFGSPFRGMSEFLRYVSSNAAVTGVTQALAQDAYEYNIQINAVLFDLLANRDVITDGGADSEQAAPGSGLEHPLFLDDLVGATLLLLSGGSDFVTGQCLVVGGDAPQHRRLED